MTAEGVDSVDLNRLLRAFSWARLGLAELLLIIVPVMPADLSPGTNSGVLALALLIAVTSSGTLLLIGALAQPLRVAWLMCLLDAVLVTAVVAATGGPRSILTFLYVLSVTAASVLLSRTGALVMAGTATILYTGLVFGRTVFPMTAYWEPPQETSALEVLTMFLNGGTFLVVAIVAGGLAERFRMTRRELETQRYDLQELQAFKEVVFHSVGTGLIVLDRDHVVTAVNQAVEAITGRPARETVGGAGSTLFGPDVSLAEAEAAIAGNPTMSPRYEITFRRPDGTTVPIRLTFSALRSDDGQRRGLIAVCEDLSEIRQMEEQIRQADRLTTLGRLSANIAHEIRNPLASLTGAIEVLTGDTVSGEARERLAGIVLRESERLNGIINNFLEYARPAPLLAETVDITELLDDVLVLLEHRQLPPGLKITREFPPSLAWRLDAQQFRQAVWNLSLNAVEAMGEGGELRIGARLGRGVLEVWVADTGEGIGPADLSHIFEPFFSTKPDGNGLGLALVYRIVHEHGGHIDVKSAPTGTIFTVTLPERHGR